MWTGSKGCGVGEQLVALHLHRGAQGRACACALRACAAQRLAGCLSPPPTPRAPSAPPAVVCVVHLGERRVTRLPAYRQWISSFGPSATHLLVGESQGTGVPTLKGFTTLQARLNALDPVLHPLMHLGDAAGGVFGGKLGSWGG